MRILVKYPEIQDYCHILTWLLLGFNRIRTSLTCIMDFRKLLIVLDFLQVCWKSLVLANHFLLRLLLLELLKFLKFLPFFTLLCLLSLLLFATLFVLEVLALKASNLENLPKNHRSLNFVFVFFIQFLYCLVDQLIFQN